MFWANQQNGGAKHIEKRPSKTDYAPRSLVFDVAVGNEASHAVNREIAEADIFKFLTKHAKNQADEHRQFVTKKIGPAEFQGRSHDFEPVIPRLFMAVTGRASLGPRFERLVQPFNPAPVKENSRIEEEDRGSAHDDNHCKIDVGPRLLRRLEIGDPT